MHQKLILPTRNTHSLTCMRWVLDQLTHGKRGEKELYQIIDEALRRNKRGPIDLRREVFGVKLPIRWSGR